MQNLRLIRHVGRALLIFFTALLWAPQAVQAKRPPLFVDNFDSGVWNPEWVSKLCCQTVIQGMLFSQDTDGFATRDALATVHDSDSLWTDYAVTLTAAFGAGTPFDHFNIVLRTDGFERGSGVSEGTGYQLEFFGPTNWPPGQANSIYLTRTDYETPISVELYHQPWTPPGGPMEITVFLIGGRIQLWINDQQIFDVEDPDPLPFGGVGLHTIFESKAWFDNVFIEQLPNSKEQCKNGGWIEFGFKNQGQCIQFVNTGK